MSIFVIYNVPVVIVTEVTGLEKINFHSNPTSAMPKNVQATIQLHSFHMLAKLCLDSFNLGFSSTWTENSQMYKLGFKEAEEPETELPTFVTFWRKQGRSRKISTSASLTVLKPLTVWFGNWKVFKEMGVPDHLTCLLRNLFVGQEATVRIGHGTTDWFKFGMEYIKALYCHLGYLTSKQSTSCQMLGWMNLKLESILPGDISTT